jgi:hypothetical protein
LTAARAAIIFFAGRKKNKTWDNDLNNGFHSKLFICRKNIINCLQMQAS